MLRKVIASVLASAALLTAAGMEPLKIRGTAFANWWRTGETVCFKGDQPIPENDHIRVKVTDVTGKTVFTGEVGGREFNEKGWCWQPPSPGYYEAEFSRSGSVDGTVTESYRFRVYKQDWQTKKYSLAGDTQIPVTKHPFAVATPTRPVAEISPVFGMSPHFSRYRDFLPLSRLVGFRGIRVHYIDWATLEEEKGVWNWKALDEFMQLAREHGYSDSDITLNLMRTPRWASTRPEATWINICIQEYKTVVPKQMEDWKNFIRMVMRRYPGVKRYELWNEPHLIGYTCFWSDSVENFVALLKAGYETVKAENPEAIVYLGGIGMRYLPFYRELLKLGGDRYYDVLPMHGSWVQMAPFRRMEKEFGRKSKPWLSSEWHAMLLRASFPWPSEPMLTRNMLCDFLNQVRQGAQEVDFFCIVNAQNFEKECLPWMKKFNPGNSSHVSGLFRKTPFLAPRYQAVAWHVLSDLVKGKLSVGEGFRFGAGQCAVALSSDAGELLIFWNGGENPVRIDGELAKIVAASTVCEADGRPVALPAEMTLAPEFYYIARNPDRKLLAAVKGRGAEVLIPQSKALPLSHEVCGNYLPGKLFDAKLELTAAGRRAPRMALRKKVATYPAVKAGEIAGFFSAALDRENFELYVEVKDAVHHPLPGKQPWEGDSVQFAFDGGGRGLTGDRIEFTLTLDREGRARLEKNFAAPVGGDLPGRYTPANEPMQTVTVAGERRNGRTIYRLRMPVSELYPLTIPQNGTVRFSLLVNNNDGNGRAYYREWASGIGGAKSPTKYGDLTVWQSPRNLLKGCRFRPFRAKADQRLSERRNGYRVDAGAISDKDASGLSVSVGNLLPNASYRLTFRARGTALIEVVCFANKQRINLLRRTALKSGWQEFSMVLTVPKGVKSVSLNFFAWEQPKVFFEVEALSLMPY
ncbi:hypothetical protein [uncultured Victivallis sp.]|uniref:hypothetical protein n=1 Tax=uncultured Victivallis sp. TaxID=354118 RepID=UPI0025D57CA4|nr:hypothetical protein [uncultured Victivallis sp.]